MAAQAVRIFPVVLTVLPGLNFMLLRFPTSSLGESLLTFLSSTQSLKHPDQRFGHPRYRFKCQGFNDITLNCSTRRTSTTVKGEAYEESEEEETHWELGIEEETIYNEEIIVADPGESLIIRRSLHIVVQTKEEPWLRHNTLYTCCTAVGKVCDVIVAIEVVKCQTTWWRNWTCQHKITVILSK